MPNWLKKVDPASARIEIVKNLPVLFGAIQGLVNMHPAFVPLFYASVGIISAYGEFGLSRSLEFAEFLSRNKGRFVEEVLNSDKFQSAFMNVLNRQFTEVSEKKREMLRSYLLNAGRGVAPEFDYHSKILWVLDQITFEEYEVLSVWQGRLQEGLRRRNPGMSETSLSEHLRSLNMNQFSFVFEGRTPRFSDRGLQTILRSLGSYGVIEVRDLPAVMVDGDTVTLHIEGITPLGEYFLKFLDGYENT